MSRPVKGWTLIVVLTLAILALVGMAAFHMAKTCLSYVDGEPNWLVILFAASTAIYACLGIACVRMIYNTILVIRLDRLMKRWGDALNYAEEVMDDDLASAVAAVEDGRMLKQKCNEIWHKIGKEPPV